MTTPANVRRKKMRELPTSPRYSFTVRDLFGLPSLAEAVLVAGQEGVDRRITRVNVMEVPDILAWVKPHEFLMTTGFPLTHGAEAATSSRSLIALVKGLAKRNVAALAVKSGRYIDDLQLDVLSAADRAAFPILRLPPAVAFDDVMSQVFTQLVDRQSLASDFADRLHEALTTIVLEGGDLTRIAEKIAELLEAAVVICKHDERAQTLAGPEEQLAALTSASWYEPSPQGFANRLVAGLQSAPDGQGQVAVAPIVAGGTDHGWIVAYSATKPLEPFVIQALERAVTVAALAITKQLAVTAVESKFRGDFLRDALLGNAGSADQVTKHCDQLGWDVTCPIKVVVAQLDGTTGDGLGSPAVRTPQDLLTAAWQQGVRTFHRKAPVVGFSHEVVALLPAPEESSDDALTAVVRTIAEGHRSPFCTGISRKIDTVADLPSAYDQARTAVRVGRRMRGPGAVSHFDSLGVYRLLSLVQEPDELRSFANETLGGLVGDDGEVESLRETLQTLLDTNCNVAETARVLHFHYNSVRYRVSKLESAVGPFMTDPNLRLNLALALRISDMRGV